MSNNKDNITYNDESDDVFIKEAKTFLDKYQTYDKHNINDCIKLQFINDIKKLIALDPDLNKFLIMKYIKETMKGQKK